jgi:molecular chaperone GrpE
MARTNGKSDIKPEQLDVEHELPAAQDGAEETQGAQQTAAIPKELTNLRGEIEKLRSERDTLVDRLARLQAEFENARKRAAKEQQEFKDFALADTIKSLLPILDSFDRALQSPTPDVQEFRSGVELIRKQLHDALSKLGLRAIPAKGEPFDPHLHEAVEMVETTSAQDDHVIDELQRGYKLKDRLLRPAMVRVARNSKK